MSSYQPPIESVAIFNSQSFPSSSYSGQHDPTKLNYPIAQGIPTFPTLVVSNNGSSSTISSTGISTSNGTINYNQIPLLNTSNSYTQPQTLGNTGNNIGSSTIGTAGYSNTFGGLSNIFNSNVAVTSVVNLVSRNYLGLYTGITTSVTLTFSLSQIYYITPSATAYTITLPAFTSSNSGAMVIFRVVGTGAGSVTLAPNSGSCIFDGTNSVGVSTHTIYAGASSATILSHTFMLLPTTLTGNVNGYGWFQLGSV